MVLIVDRHGTVKLYHHSDGYWSWFGKRLLDIASKIYTSTSELDVEMVADKIMRAMPETKVANMIHSDLEWLYVIRADKKQMDVYNGIHFDNEDEEIYKFGKYDFTKHKFVFGYDFLEKGD